jgi:hypothetical protein
MRRLADSVRCHTCCRDRVRLRSPIIAQLKYVAGEQVARLWRSDGDFARIAKV